MESASGWRIDGARDFSTQKYFRTRGIRVGGQRCREKTNGIRVAGMLIDLISISMLYQAADIHDA